MLEPEPFLELFLNVAPPVELNGGSRRFIAILGGESRGALRGTVRGGGADWQDVAPDGRLEIDARYLVDTEWGPVEVRSTGVRAGPPEVLAQLAAGQTVDPAGYYFRTFLRFTASDPRLTHLNATLAVAKGARLGDQVHLTAHRVS